MDARFPITFSLWRDNLYSVAAVGRFYPSKAKMYVPQCGRLVHTEPVAQPVDFFFACSKSR